MMLEFQQIIIALLITEAQLKLIYICLSKFHRMYVVRMYVNLHLAEIDFRLLHRSKNNGIIYQLGRK